MLKRIKFFSFIAVLVLSFAGSMLAQDVTGAIEGTVRDSAGALVPGATVKVEGNAFSRTTTANSEGFFRILGVPPGILTVTASADNFKAGEASATVVVGKATPVNFTLQPASIGETVTITSGEVAAIDTGSSRVQENITSQRFEEIPKGTNFTSVLATTPSVRQESKGAGFQIDGSSGAENTFIIDGQEVTNFRDGQLNTNNNLPFGLVQEIQIKSGGFEAEHGGATGGVISLVTKRGGNTFNGDASISFQTSRLEPKPNRILSPDSSVRRFVSPPKDGYTNVFPSFSLGGPIVKDRLWFFASYNVQSFITERTVDYANGARENYRSNVRRDYGFLRLDTQLNDKISLSGSYTYNPLRQHGLLDSVTGIAGQVPPNNNNISQGAAFLNTQGGRQAASNVNGSVTITPNSNWIISVRAGQSYLNEKLNSYNVPTIERIRCITAGTNCTAGFSNIPSNFDTLKDISKRRTFDADATVIVDNFGGRHSIKFGYQYNGLSNDVDRGYFDIGEVRLFFGRTIFGIGNRNSNEIGYGYLQRFGTRGKTSSSNSGLYLQDSWTIGRLTLNPGIRIEKEDVPSFSATGVPIEFGWGDKPAPRFGAAFDVLGNGRWKVYGGYGWFYDRFKYELPRGSFGGDKFLRDYFPILASNSNWQSYTRQYALANSEVRLDFRVPSNDPADNRVDPDLKAARESSLDLGTEFEMARNWVLGARFVHKQIDRTIEDVGIFDNAGNELYYIANPGFGVVSRPLLTGVPATPKAERVYDALEIKLDKRFSNNYFFNASYTLSRLFGNYSGLASSDENGRSSPNVNRFFDLPFIGFTADGKPDNGRLATDRPHVFKLNAGYAFDWMGSKVNSTEFKTFFLAQSGTPISTRVQFYSAGTFLNGRGDLGRTPTFTQTDFAVTHRYKFGRDARYTMAFDLDILNLFNQRTVTNVHESIDLANYTATRDMLNLAGVPLNDEAAFIQKIFTGGLSAAVKELQRRAVAGENTCWSASAGAYTGSCAAYRPDARYKAPSDFQTPLSLRFGFRFIF